MKSSRSSQSQLNLGPMPLANETRDESALPKCTQREDAQRIAAELFDEALTNARIETGEVAYILDISESLVRRMRSTDARECVSSVQLLMMPPRVQFEFIAAWYRRQGFGRAALARVLDSIGLLSLSVER